MSNLQGKLVQQGQALILTEVNTNFRNMATALQNDKGIALTVEQSYLSKYDVADELRKLVKDKISKPPAEIKSLLDPTKLMSDIVAEAGAFDRLEDYLNNTLSSADYEPPLKLNFVSVTNTDVRCFPNKTTQDPRRTGWLIKPGPADVLKSTEVQRWMINNSVLYGFVLYDDNALYYAGVDGIRARLQKAANPNEELQSIISTFLRSTRSLSLLTNTAQQILNNPTQNTGTYADPSNLESIPGSTAKNNRGDVPDLVVIDDQPVVRETGLAYLAMKQEAAKVGITLKIVSGFRPAFGTNFSSLTSKGRTINITTQEALRRDKSRWKGYERDKYNSDDDFVFRAPASAYNPATAPPGLSNHGSGIAIDLNTGGRDNFSPLNSPIYVWLVQNSHRFGFIRTVGSEEWHYEYLPQLAKNGPYAKIDGTDTNKFYSDLSLSTGQFAV